MKNKETIKNLESLVQLDIDAIHAYNQAIEKIEEKPIKGRLEEFRADHERHVTNLSKCIESLGGEAPPFSRDFKGFIIEGMTALRSISGTEGALKAMKMNEGLTNTMYDRALKWDLPVNVRAVVERNRDDERRHLEYIDNAIKNRAWEQKAA